MNISITRIPAFDDNYLWLLANESGDALVVDPGDATPVIQHLDSHQLNLVGILVTHHHGDHIGGVSELVSRYGCTVYGPSSEYVPQVDEPLKEGDRIELLGVHFAILEVPGHTLDHIVYYSNDIAETPVLFSGDTLFAGGCGRVFEGTPAQMHASLTKLTNLPHNTKIFCAHEYTLANLTFASAVEPDNAEVKDRLKQVERLRENNIATVPTTLGEELATNPFLRSEAKSVVQSAMEHLGHPPHTAVETFTTIRKWKDNF